MSIRSGPAAVRVSVEASTGSFAPWSRLLRWRDERRAQRHAEHAEQQVFRARHGYPLNLRNPTTFSEKLCWRKLRDRDPRLPVVVDKLAVRGFITDMLGIEAANRILVPLLYTTTDPSTIPFEALPAEYIVKANHGSGYNLIVREPNKPTKERVIELSRSWLATAYGTEWHEWAYQEVHRAIVVESLLTNDDGKPPREYKFQMFDGRCALIQALNSNEWYDGHDRPDSTMPTLTYFTPEWTHLDVSWDYYFLEHQFPTDPLLPRPARLAEMLSLAERLSKPFDYIRVDLYDTPSGIKFGELTPYHLTGHSRISPFAFDVELGQRWRQRSNR